MKIKRFILFVIIFMAIMSFMTIAMRDYSCFAYMLFWDLKALVMFLLIPLLSLLITNKPKDIVLYITTAISQDENQENVKRSILFFNSYRKTLFYTGFLIAFFSTMMLLSDLSSVSLMGRNAGTGLCGIIYPLLTIILIVLPIENSLKQRIK